MSYLPIAKNSSDHKCNIVITMDRNASSNELTTFKSIVVPTKTRQFGYKDYKSDLGTC